MSVLARPMPRRRPARPSGPRPARPSRPRRRPAPRPRRTAPRRKPPRRSPRRPTAPRPRPAPRPALPRAPGAPRPRLPLPFRPRLPLGPLEVIWPLSDLPAVLVPQLPVGTSHGLCTSPRSDITSMHITWLGACGALQINNANACLSGQAGKSGLPWDNTKIMGVRDGQYSVLGLTRYQVLEAWCYPAPFTRNPVAPRPRPMGAPRSPGVATPQAERNYRLGYGLPHGYDYGPHPGANPNGRAYSGIAITVARGAMASSTVSIAPAPNASGNPRPPRERERKANGRAGVILGRMLGAFSDGREFITALWRALPDHVRAGTRSTDTFAQVEAIYLHYDEINFGALAWYLAQDIVEDRIVGGFYREIDRRGYGHIENQIDWLNSAYGHPGTARNDLLEWLSRTGGI